MKLRTIVMIMLCAFLMGSCSGESAPEPTQAPESSPEPGSSYESVIGNIPAGSILLFQNDEGAVKLNRDMEEGIIPVECRAMYDEMGARPEVVVTDPEIITEAYNRLGHMMIGDKANESITDCYHYIIFKLQDGTTVGWHFEGTGLLCWGRDNYTVTDPGSLWNMVRAMQDEETDD